MAAERAAPRAPAEREVQAISPQTMSGVVARGRTVSLAGRQHGPGTLLEGLSVEDYAHLLSTGFLTDPRVPQLVPSNGPQFTGAVDGVVSLR
jgi:hypothetical protein